ncbi:MAG: folate-binding protein YgfZ [Cyanobacteria bacterium CRU_2_1]|nr:folate-binding protein YgfZ [Cyanobacteria bacterium RU_5_0]NJR60465.1 folate-binding protein YgfZ [Cyanobacteria bacterium CRU_2_1]
MTQQLQDLQLAAGATFMKVAGVEVPANFGNQAAALEATQTGVAVYDRSHWGRIQVTGDDRLRFLHNQTTNNFQSLQPEQGCDTVFVTSTGRTIDLISAYALNDSVLLLTSPGYTQKLIKWMDQYIFFADKVELKDITTTTSAFSLIGSESNALLTNLGAAEITTQHRNDHHIFNINGIEVQIAVGSGLATSGYTLIADASHAANLWTMLIEAGAIPLGEEAWERLRIEQGRPMPDRELTDDFNPLEAGLWYTISLSKGCYIGQETIARLHTYRGVKQQLWGVRFGQSVDRGSAITVGDEKIGKLTSDTQTDDGYFGLAYIRTKAIVPNLKVQLGNVEGELVAVPFLSHEYL